VDKPKKPMTFEETVAHRLKIIAWAKEFNRRQDEAEAELAKVVELPRKKVDSSPSSMPKRSVVVPFRKPSNRSE